MWAALLSIGLALWINVQNKESWPGAVRMRLGLRWLARRCRSQGRSHIQSLTQGAALEMASVQQCRGAYRALVEPEP